MSTLPYGIFSTLNTPARVGLKHGDVVIDLSGMERAGWFSSVMGFTGEPFFQSTLNAYMELGRPVWKEVRRIVVEALHSKPRDLHPFFVPLADCILHHPARIGDYTDFYSSYHHAFRVGSMFRGPENALNPNWTKLPVGYHGRSSSIVLSGTDVRRPKGQTPEFGPTKKLDFELEMGFFVGPSSALGTPIPIEQAENHIFGLTLLNDWSARDIQAFEYQPLGPFTAKNFCTSISPWIVPLEALEPFRCTLPTPIQKPLDYLAEPSSNSYDISLQVWVNGDCITRTNFNTLYWSMAQQLAHHTITGCDVRAGDLMGSGTISGEEPGSEGCLLEKNSRFLNDGDVVELRAYAERDGLRIEFDSVSGRILPVLI